MYATLDDMTAAFGLDELVAITDRDHTDAVDVPLVDAALLRAGY